MKKGFTLIELLAVIIILAVITLITTPIVLNVVENAKEKSRISSVNSLIDATKLYMTEALLDDSIDLSGNLLDIINNRVKGTKPDEGEIKINGNDIGIAVKIDGICYIKDYSEEEIRKTNDSECIIFKEVEAACYGEETEVIDIIEINYDGCINYLSGQDIGYTEEEISAICKNEKKIEDIYYLKNYIIAMSMLGEDIREFIDNNIIEVTYKKECQTCFEYEKNYSYEIDYEECMNSILAEEFENEDLKKLCSDETITVEEEEISIKDITEEYESMLELYIQGIIYLNYGGVVITNYLCYEENAYLPNETGLPIVTDVVIPTTINGLKVVEIADVDGDNGIYSFAYRGLTSVDFTNARYLEKIGNGAFTQNFYRISEDYIIKGEIDLSNTKVTSIGDFAFYNNLITSIELPDSITSIGEDAFNANMITSLKLSDSIVYIGSGAFNVNLLPDDQAFIYKRTDLNNDGIAEIDDSVLISYGGAKRTNVVFPSNIKEIDVLFDGWEQCDWFDGVLDLSQTSIKEIRNKTFYYVGITGVKLPNTIEKIGSSAFRGNQISGELDLSNLTNLTTIEYGTFFSNQITSIKLPNSITTIGTDAFRSNQISGELDLSDLTNLTSISGFNGNQITGFKLPNSVTEIGFYAFSDNQISGELDLSNLTNLTTIGYEAFWCDQITSVKIPNSVKTINYNAFGGNSNLTLIEIDNVKDAIEGAPWGYNNAIVKWLRDSE